MEEVFKKILEFCNLISPEQIVAVIVLSIAITMIASIAKKTVQTIMTVIAILALLYFLKPDLYVQLMNWLNILIQKIKII